MAKKLGRAGRLEASFDNGTTWGLVGKIIDQTLDDNTEEVDATTHDSNGYREYEIGLTDASLTFNIMYDEQDPSHSSLLEAKRERTRFQFRWIPQVGAGLPRRHGVGFITALSHTAPLDGMQTMDITLRVSGEITNETQT